MQTILKCTLFSLLLVWCSAAARAAVQPDDPGLYSQAELDQMLAPVALYPDVLLSQVLMASTYPLEVVEASRWSKAHPGIEGDEAIRAAETEDWDESVKALTAFPDLLSRMDENLSWTRRLGEAFLGQEEQVMETIQNLRQKALDNGSLESLDHLAVDERAEGIVIEPVDTRVVYVPWYRTTVVYGDWWWYGYPPICWDPPNPYYSSISFYWGRPFRLSTGFYFSSFDWDRHRVVVWNRDRNPYYHRDYKRYEDRRPDYRDAPEWRHDPYHRKGVSYRDRELNSRYETRQRHDEPRHRVSNPAPTRPEQTRPAPPQVVRDADRVVRDSDRKQLQAVRRFPAEHRRPVVGIQERRIFNREQMNEKNPPRAVVRDARPPVRQPAAPVVKQAPIVRDPQKSPVTRSTEKSHSSVDSGLRRQPSSASQNRRPLFDRSDQSHRRIRER